MELQDPKVMISKVSQFRKMLDFESFEEFNQLANNLFYQPIKVAKILLEFRMKDLIRNRSSVLLVIQELEKSLAATVQALALSQCRKLVICGDSDIYVDQQEFIFFDQCSHLQLEVFEQCGHVPFLEYPKKTDQLVRKFLLEKHTSRLDSY
jgi:pimeloyl-ACP methyl ester carboxylesterase